MTRPFKIGIFAGAAFCLAACAAEPPPTEAEQANASACTADADAVYNSQNYDALSRTGQNGVFFAPDPDRVFDSQRLGSLHDRDSQITACEQNGKDEGSIAPGTQIVTPQIVGQ